MTIRPMGAELCHVDGRTDMTKLIVAFSNFANASKKSILYHKLLFLSSFNPIELNLNISYRLSKKCEPKVTLHGVSVSFDTINAFACSGVTITSNELGQLQIIHFVVYKNTVGNFRSVKVKASL